VPSASNDERELTTRLQQQDYFFYQKQSQSYQLHLNVILKFIITNINLPYLQRFKMYFAGAVLYRSNNWLKAGQDIHQLAI
jgi:hypothetical protein